MSVIRDDEKDISTEVGYNTVGVPDQICGQWFPDHKIKPWQRWVYRIILFFVLITVIAEAIGAIALLVS